MMTTVVVVRVGSTELRQARSGQSGVASGGACLDWGKQKRGFASPNYRRRASHAGERDTEAVSDNF